VGIEVRCSPAAMTRGGSRNPAGGEAWGGRRLGFKGGSAPVVRRSRKQAGYVQLDPAKLLAAASSGRTSCRRFEPAASWRAAGQRGGGG
jgi:hypothetical protein